MAIDGCTHGYANRYRGVATQWTCAGSFVGDAGTRIAHLTIDAVQSDQPIGTYAVMVASPTATRAYWPGHRYVGDIIVIAMMVALAGWLIYLSAPSVMARRIARRAKVPARRRPRPAAR